MKFTGGLTLVLLHTNLMGATSFHWAVVLAPLTVGILLALLSDLLEKEV